MKREEAINLLGWFKSKTNREDDLEAIDMAIKSLSEPSGDLISRADAIEAVHGACVYCDTCDLKDIGCSQINALSPLPSANTDMSEYCDRLWKIAYERGKAEAEQHNKDAISREGLLKSWEELSPRGRLEFDQVIMTIPALPSAEAVSREEYDQLEALYDAIRIYDSEADATCATCADRALCIMSAPDGNWKACKDYRPSAEQVTGKLKKTCDSLLTDDSEACKEQKSKLESAEAVQGEWIRKNYHTYICNQCGYEEAIYGNVEEYKFCSHCGAKMTKGGDDE